MTTSSKDFIDHKSSVIQNDDGVIDMSKICFGLLTAHVHSGGSDFKNNDLHLTFLLKPRGAKYVQTLFTKAHHSELGIQRQLYT